MTVTEFARFTLKSGMSLEPGSPELIKFGTAAWKDALAQPGAQRAYFGTSVENPAHVWGFMDWDTIEDHINWTKHPQNAEVMKELIPYFEPGDGFVKHVAVEPTPISVLHPDSGAGVVELLTAFFPADQSAEDRQEVSRLATEFVDKSLKTCPDFKGASHGWGIETDFPIPGAEEEGKTGAVFVAFIGWPDIEAHMRFRETEPFKEHIGLLRSFPGCVKMAMVHVKCTPAGVGASAP